jgi:hypothetical protein
MTTTPAHLTEFIGKTLHEVFTQAAGWAQEHDNGVITALACVITYEHDEHNDWGHAGTEMVRFSLVTQDCHNDDCCGK